MKINFDEIKDLKKFYKKVKICKICKKAYGIDREEKEYFKICPFCLKKIVNSKRSKSKQ